MKRIGAIILVIACILPAMSQQTKKLTAEKHNEYGLVYSLPLTAFRIEVVAVKETKVGGPFSKYAKIFTSNSNVISKDEVNWTIESVRVTPYGVADQDDRYLMQLKPGALTYIEVAEDGMLLSINKEVEFPQQAALQVTEMEGTPVTGKEYLNYVNEDFISATSSYKKAQLIAEEIMEVRDARLSLTRGTADTMPTDGRQLEIMLGSLENQEQSLVNAFTGASWKERIVRTYTFLPEEEGKSVLCRVSATEGLVAPDNTKGDPLYVTIYPTEEAQLPVDAKGEEKKVPKDAVMYCIPGTAELTLNYKGNNLFREEFPVSQFGVPFGLSPSIFTDKKEPSFAIFDPSTGALKELGTLK